MAENTLGRLSLEGTESVFRNDILPDYPPTTMMPAERPRLILLAPSAGKAAVLIANDAEREHSASNRVPFRAPVRQQHGRVVAVGDDVRTGIWRDCRRRSAA